MARKLTLDRWLAGAVLLLTCFGLMMVFSASAMVSARDSGSFGGFLARQALASLLGLGALFGATRFDYARLRHPAVLWGLLAVCLALLIVVLAGGSQRWIRIAGFSFQPSELAKLALILFLADALDRKKDRLGDLRGFVVPCLGLIGLFLALIYVQPDFGTTATLAIITFCLFFIAGMPWRLIGGMTLIGGLGLALLATRADYRWRRLVAFLNPATDPQGQNFQMNQSLIAIGSGGAGGMGLGESSQKLFFLPAAHTDFIFSVIGEELGFLGCLLVIAAFLVILWRGTRVALRAPDPFGAYLAAGITLSIVLQAFINIGVTVGMLPTKGLPLPFVSYGGSSLLVSLAAAGVALNVSQHSG